jgi:hypothetical protein
MGRTPRRVRIQEEITRACQMTSAASRARTLFSAGAAHHPSPCLPRNAWSPAQHVAGEKRRDAATGAAHALSRDR